MIASYDNFVYKTDDPVFEYHINRGLSEPYPRELAIVKRYLSQFPDKNNVCIDVGGHIGTTSFPYSRLYKSVIAFEPNPKSYDFFVENVKLNQVKNVEVVNKGVYNKTMKCIVKQHSGANSGCFCIEESENGIDVVKLDDHYLDHPIDFIKIDTEGSELYVLEGSVEIIKRYKPLIQVETNECCQTNFGYSKQNIYDFLYQHGYSVYDDDGNNPLFY